MAGPDYIPRKRGESKESHEARLKVYRERKQSLKRGKKVGKIKFMKDIPLPAAIVIGAALIAAALTISNGIYVFETRTLGAVYRYNKLTGSIALCVNGEKCVKIEKYEYGH